jgi:hypothetical protein
MEIKDFTQAMALQKELSAKLRTNVDKLVKEKAAPIADTLKQQEALLARAKAELANSEKEKELVLKRFDMKIQQRKATVEQLDKGLKEMKKNLKKQESSTKNPVQKRRTVRTKNKK